MRGIVWALAGAAVVSALVAGSILADPYATQDLALFSAISLTAWFAFLACAVALRPRAWHWWFPAAWLGMGIATLALAYKDSFGPELRALGPLTLLWHAMLHLLIAPIELLLGYVVGFVDPRAPLYVLASVAVCLLGAELLRRRLWPRLRGAASAVETRL